MALSDEHNLGTLLSGAGHIVGIAGSCSCLNFFFGSGSPVRTASTSFSPGPFFGFQPIPKLHHRSDTLTAIALFRHEKVYLLPAESTQIMSGKS